MERDRGLERPDQKPKSQNNAYLKEQGKGSPGFPTLKPEQPPHGGGIKSPERQPLPSVWDILERMVRVDAKDVEDRPRRGSQEYKRELEEVNRLVDEVRFNGTPRDKLTFNLYKAAVSVLGGLPVPLTFRNLSLEEFQQLRSRMEPVSDKELTEEVRKAEAELKRKAKELRKGRRSRIPGIVHY